MFKRHWKMGLNTREGEDKDLADNMTKMVPPSLPDWHYMAFV